MTLLNNGNAAIGTTAPLDKLVISDGTDHMSLGPLGVSNFVGLAVGNVNVSASAYFLGANSTTTSLNTSNASGSLLFNINNATKLTIASTGNVTSTGTITATQFKLSALNTAPSSASDTGTTGEIRIVNGFIYVCVSTNTWQRAAISTF